MPRGGKRPGAGRKPGTPNRVTAASREAFQALLDANMPKVQEMIDEVRFGIEIEKQTEQGTVVGRLNADPKGALELLLKMARFCVPELARTEVAGADGGPVQVIVQKYEGT